MDIRKPKTTTLHKTRTTKKSSNKRHKNTIRARIRPPMVDYLPTEIITDVLARVAASSVADLFRCKLSCKALHEISDEKKVLQQVSIESLFSRAWRSDNKTSSFFTRCVESNNPEALLRLGMEQYFSHMMLEEGLKNLEKAAEQRNKEAAYVLGLILLCSGEKECTKRGVELIMNIFRVIGGKGIVECRKKLRDLTRSIWLNNKVIAEANPKISCAMQQQHEVKSNNWESSNYYFEDVEDNNVVCELCKCDRDVKFFLSIVR